MTYEEKWERAVQARMACACETRKEAEEATRAVVFERRAEWAAEVILLLDELAKWAAARRRRRAKARQAVQDAERWAGRPLTKQEREEIVERSMAEAAAMRRFNDRLREDFGF